jgi:sialic acid synthase SpsE
MGGYGPVERAVTNALEVGNSEVALLHCISEYPTAPEDANIRRIERLQAAFGTVVGYSDHTMSVDIPVTSIALGSSIVEKHLTLDRTLSGPDHSFALEPDEFEEMVDAIREVESALGTGVKLAPSREEEEIRADVQLKLVLSTDVLSGQSLSPDVVCPRRSPDGIPYRLLDELDDTGITVKENLQEGTLITWNHLTNSE